MVPQINTRGDLVLQGMAPHTIPPAGRVVCHCEAKIGLRRLPRGFRTRTRLSSLLRLNLDSSLKKTWFIFRCNPVSSCVVPLQTEASMGGRQAKHT
ncbi:hypothetical protein TNCV_2530341 [Trichonephila clavipes]|nr:hypothetical protein TNCV_2530341 [Trichonephila clavipes]